MTGMGQVDREMLLPFPAWSSRRIGQAITYSGGTSTGPLRIFQRSGWNPTERSAEPGKVKRAILLQARATLW